MSDRLIPNNQYMSKSAQPTPIASPLSPRIASNPTAVDWSNYESMVDDMAKGLEPQFKQDLCQIEQWFKHLNISEKTTTLFNLTQHINPAQVKFMMGVLRDMAQKSNLLSPMLDADDPFQPSPLNSRLVPFMQAKSPQYRATSPLFDMPPPKIQITSPNPLRRSQTVPTRKSAGEEYTVPLPPETSPLKRTNSSSKGKIPEIIDFKQLEDIAGFLKLLRLHKYTENLKNYKWREWIKMDDEALEKAGVAALGARRKMLKVFEVIQQNMKDQGIE
eukprot:NODE_302_length_11399_cov_0.339115.p5 type:complete len:274 gc:universal NODE_302_length_11399_cov_0.339115:10030-9209(-)